MLDKFSLALFYDFGGFLAFNFNKFSTNVRSKDR
jgi:hypothetical protein